MSRRTCGWCNGSGVARNGESCIACSGKGWVTFSDQSYEDKIAADGCIDGCFARLGCAAVILIIIGTILAQVMDR